MLPRELLSQEFGQAKKLGCFRPNTSVEDEFNEVKDGRIVYYDMLGGLSYHIDPMPCAVREMMPYVNGALIKRLDSTEPALNQYSDEDGWCQTSIVVDPGYVVARLSDEQGSLLSIGVSTWSTYDSNKYEEETDAAWSVAEKLFLEAARLKGTTRGMPAPERPEVFDEEVGQYFPWVAIINMVPNPPRTTTKFLVHLALAFQICQISQTDAQRISENKS